MFMLTTCFGTGKLRCIKNDSVGGGGGDVFLVGGHPYWIEGMQGQLIKVSVRSRVIIDAVDLQSPCSGHSEMDSDDQCSS